MSTPLDNSDLKSLAEQLLSAGPHKTYAASPRRIRVEFNKTYIADTRQAVYVWEHEYYPFLYIPSQDFLRGVEREKLQDIKDGAASIVALKVGGKTLNRVIEFQEHQSVPESLRGLARLEFKAADAWYEEDTRILVHPKDPFKRVDVLPSTASVGVSLNGTKIAATPFSMHLYETGLPVRYYMPMTAIAQEHLRPSTTRTQCPYKGEAEYFDIVVGDKVFKDLVWYYNSPNLECAGIKGLACFYNEKVDLDVDGVTEKRPQTHFG